MEQMVFSLVGAEKILKEDVFCLSTITFFWLMINIGLYFDIAIVAVGSYISMILFIGLIVFIIPTTDKSKVKL